MGPQSKEYRFKCYLTKNRFLPIEYYEHPLIKYFLFNFSVSNINYSVFKLTSDQFKEFLTN
ncbi:hypothetical protein A0H76_2779 [Hepatospora eriocheir]|uniref:Uncharacterized protein n=1 Tax=Hepatospora eriocheir TaxID=1081669 RepID=A0A1X0QES0_9MICR|nr:hypothetical protein A0H76_2779 [Hepatospora eriocheir]